MFWALFEVFVHVYIVSLGMADLLETVHVQLPDERCKIMMFEVGGEYFFCESGDIFDDEGITCCGPADYLFDFFILDHGKGTSTI